MSRAPSLGLLPLFLVELKRSPSLSLFLALSLALTLTLFFHSRRICYCELGFTHKPGFHQEISKLEVFLQDPWTLRPAVDSTTTTIQVEVPRLEPSQLVGTPGSPLFEEPEPISDGIRDEVVGGGVGGGSIGGHNNKEESAWAQSVRAKRAELQRQAAEASVAAEDYVRRLEAGAAAMVILLFSFTVLLYHFKFLVFNDSKGGRLNCGFLLLKFAILSGISHLFDLILCYNF
jgi:hypothetical protein